MENASYWMTRRTIRKYDKTRSVSDELLRDLMEKAMQAPTTGNMQLYSVVVTRDGDKLADLAKEHFNQPASTGADVLLTFCADFNRFTKWCDARNARHGFSNLQSLMSAVLDTTIVAQQFTTLAEMAGLGVCYLGTTTYNAPGIAKKLGLPKMVVPIVTLAVGYPAEEGEVSDRLPLDGVMHYEVYKDYSAEDIDRIYAPKEAREDSKRFVAENGKETLAQVFTDVRYPERNNVAFSEVLLEFLKSAGF